MTENKLHQIYLAEELATPSAVYQWLSQKMAAEGVTQQAEVLYQQLLQRESLGSIMIAENIALPHVESSEIQYSQVVFLKLAEPIEWENQGTVKLLIVIFLKQDEKIEIKKRIAGLTRRLADEAFVEKLLSVEKMPELTELIGNI